MTASVPLTFLRYQYPNIRGMFGAGLRSALPLPGGAAIEPPTPPIQRRMPPVPQRLISAYSDWTGAPPERYDGVLPPHMFSYWALGLSSELIGQAPYNLMSIVNQGCRMVTRQLLPADEAIEVGANLADISDDGRRIRIAAHMDAGTASAPDAQSIDIMTAVPRRNPKPRKSADRNETPPEDFETVGQWTADANDGRNFALLTGDFNPLHTLPPVGRRTRYGTCILHGFGILSRTYEAIRNAGVEIAEFDVRYVKPVPLPSRQLAVQLAGESSDGSRALRLSSPDGTLHMVGQLQEETSR